MIANGDSVQLRPLHGTCEHMGARTRVHPGREVRTGVVRDSQRGNAAGTAQRRGSGAAGDSRTGAAGEGRAVPDGGKNSKTPWTDYLVTSQLSGKTYRVALRGPNEVTRIVRVPIFASTRWGPASISCMCCGAMKSRFSAAATGNGPIRHEGFRRTFEVWQRDGIAVAHAQRPVAAQGNAVWPGCWTSRSRTFRGC